MKFEFVPESPAFAGLFFDQSKGKTMQFVVKSTLAVFMLLPVTVIADGPVTGPVVDNFGPVFSVPEGSFNLDPEQVYRIIMDVGKGPDAPAQLNRNIESAARLLNMSARNGIKPENLQLAVVLHGSGARAALNEQAHDAHFKMPNGSKALLEELGKAGVDIYLCGQTAAYYGYGAEDLLPEVTLAVSAMTVHVRLQQEGYRAILF
jgi:intracellular sulfur oxidation DsrE/DsrF family protein